MRWSSNPEVPGSIPGLHKCADTIMATRMGLIKSGAVHDGCWQESVALKVV